MNEPRRWVRAYRAGIWWQWAAYEQSAVAPVGTGRSLSRAAAYRAGQRRMNRTLRKRGRVERRRLQCVRTIGSRAVSRG